MSLLSFDAFTGNQELGPCGRLGALWPAGGLWPAGACDRLGACGRLGPCGRLGRHLPSSTRLSSAGGFWCSRSRAFQWLLGPILVSEDSWGTRRMGTFGSPHF